MIKKIFIRHKFSNFNHHKICGSRKWEFWCEITQIIHAWRLSLKTLSVLQISWGHCSLHFCDFRVSWNEKRQQHVGGLLNRKMGWALLFQWYFIDIDITHHIYGSLLWLDGWKHSTSQQCICSTVVNIILFACITITNTQYTYSTCYCRFMYHISKTGEINICCCYFIF